MEQQPKSSSPEIEEDQSVIAQERHHSKGSATEGKVTGVIKELIRNTAIPGPGDEINNEMYKILVNKFTNSFYDANTEPMEAEETARKLASWVMKYDDKIKEMRIQRERESTRAIPPNEKTKDGSSRDPHVKLYHVANHLSDDYWNKTGQVVELVDQDGRQVFVKELMNNEKKTTLVKKIGNTEKGNEISSWILEVPDREKLKEVEESFSSSSDWLNESASSGLRSPVTVDEWKTLADIQMGEALSWNSYLAIEKIPENGRPESSGVSGIQFKPIIQPVHATRKLRKNNNVININKFSKQTKETLLQKPSTTFASQSLLKKKKLEKKSTNRYQVSDIRESLEAVLFNLPYRPYYSR